MDLTYYPAGGARGKPSPAAIGAVLSDSHGKVVHEISRYIGETTNNQAEYQALLAALTEAKNLHATNVKCFLDSLLVVKQLNQEYKVKDQGLAPLFIKIWNLSQGFKSCTFIHVPRTKNIRADELVNEALDKIRNSNYETRINA